ncbi:hypothetical protein LOAG_08432 [Loa loa]|uniref:Uncharacterized protein n=1 Tax=Loa loa TaxID=7209 RepID=A0A1S0TTZ1_LOALO|nr:hypothetical protein LOAG_08432 [Loa loa]EFO20061.2 hypothetical protein LOAG_08432 [Loa loa]
MHSGHNGRRRGFMRPVTATSNGSIFRTLPLFCFLTGLLFFFIFYIYQAQNAELYDMRNQIELERGRHIKVKSENIECSRKLTKQDNALSFYMMNLKQLQDDKNEGSINAALLPVEWFVTHQDA